MAVSVEGAAPNGLQPQFFTLPEKLKVNGYISTKENILAGRGEYVALGKKGFLLLHLLMNMLTLWIE